MEVDLGDPEQDSDPSPAAIDSGSDSDHPPSSSSPIHLLPRDALHHIIIRLSLRQALACRVVCRHFNDALSSTSFLSLLPPLRLLALRHPRHPSALHALDSASGRWLRIPLSFLPFPSPSPIAAAGSCLYLWADPSPSPTSAQTLTLTKHRHHPKYLVACNPLTRSHHVLPTLGSAWSRHGIVLVSPAGLVLVLTELAALSYAPGSPRWLKFSLNLPSKPRSPILVGRSVFALCDVGSPWRSQWKLFSCGLGDLGAWAQLERHEWGDVFDILKRPRLLRGFGAARILMVGGLRSSFALDAPCSTILILRLDLGTLEWDEAGRMPLDMYRCFASGAAGGNNKVKVFGGDGRVWFSGKRMRGKMAMWEEEEGEVVGKGSGGGGWWKWIDGVPGYNEGVYRGFVFNAALTGLP